MPRLRVDSPATAQLRQVEEKVAAARAVLVRLLQEVVVAESRLDKSQAAQLLAANEQLVVTALRDRTEAELAAQVLSQVTRSAERDPLTQLPNRVLLLDRFAQAIAGAKRHGQRIALLFLDLDNFKQINDTLGHAVGDEVLKVVAQRLTSSVRDADTVSRHGGDEFLIVLGDVSEAADAAWTARKLSDVLAEPFRAGDQTLRLAASIGISLYPDDGDDVKTLIERADAAMYMAKRDGLRTFFFHGEAALADAALPPQPGSQQPGSQQPITRHARALADHERQHGSLREANEQLLLAALDARHLRAAAEQAQQRQTEFLALVAQELADPLAPIRLATAMLGRVHDDASLLGRAQAIIERQLATIVGVVDAVTDMAQAPTAPLDLERLPIDLGAVVRTAVASCRPALDMRAQSLELVLASQPLQVVGDRRRLTQIVCNLLANASRFTADHGAIRLQVEADDNEVVIQVVDNGIGIAPQALPTVFDCFVQDAHGLGFNGVGPGIGLTVVRTLVEAHGGTVDAASAGVGQGSRFIVTLPLVDATATPQ